MAFIDFIEREDRAKKSEIAPSGYEIVPFDKNFTLIDTNRIYLESHGWIQAGSWAGLTPFKVRREHGYSITSICQPAKRFKTDKPYPFGY